MYVSLLARSQSKVDVVQQAFYDLVGLTTMPNVTLNNIEAALVTPSGFYRKTNLVLNSYTAPNVLVYLVDGGQHCFTPFKYLYTANTYGKEAWATQIYPNVSESSTDEPVITSDVTLLNWTTALPLERGESLSSACSGPIKEEREWRGTTYCAPFVVGQTYEAEER